MTNLVYNGCHFSSANSLNSCPGKTFLTWGREARSQGKKSQPLFVQEEKTVLSTQFTVEVPRHLEQTNKQNKNSSIVRLLSNELSKVELAFNLRQCVGSDEFLFQAFERFIPTIAKQLLSTFHHILIGCERAFVLF